MRIRWNATAVLDFDFDAARAVKLGCACKKDPECRRGSVTCVLHGARSRSYAHLFASLSV